MRERERGRVGGITKEKLKWQLFPTFLLDGYRQSTGKCRANLATSESRPLRWRTLCGFSLSYNWCFSPLLLGQQTTASLSCNGFERCRFSGNKNHSLSNQTRQISKDSHMQELQIQTEKHVFSLSLFALYLCFIVCTRACNCPPFPHSL